MATQRAFAMPESAPSADERPDCSVVIVNYHSEEFLRPCLESLALASEGVRTEVLVVDNSRTLTEVDLAAVPLARLLRSPRNVGFARACNAAMAVATGRHVLLLNPDTVVHAGALAAMVGYLDAHPETGAVGARLLNTDGTLQYSCRRFPRSLSIFFGRYALLTRLLPGNPLTRDYLYLDWDHATAREVDWVSGACLMVRREVLDRVGGLDGGYFLFVEDMDWCRRIRETGSSVAYVPEAVVTHHIGISRGPAPPRIVWERHRSMLRYIRKHFAWPWPLVVLAGAGLAVHGGVALGLGLAGLAAGALTPVVQALARRRGLVALRKAPGREPIPTLGGLAVVAAVLGVLWTLQLLDRGIGITPILGLSLAAVPLVAVGIRDDLVGCGRGVRLAASIVAGVIVHACGLGITELTNPLGSTLPVGPLAPALTVIWVALAINAMGLLGELDGLGAGVGAIAGLSLGLVGLARGEREMAALAFLLGGASAGFFPYNFPRARIYLGGVGSTFIGLVLGATALVQNHKAATALTLLVPLVALGLPALDGALARLRRSTGGVAPRADLDHLQHRLLALGLTAPQAVTTLLLVTAGLGLLAVALADADKHHVLTMMLVLAVALGAVLRLAGRLERPATARIEAPPGGERARPAGVRR